MRPCFKFTAAAGNKPAVLALDEEIGLWGTQAKDFRAQLAAVEGDNLIVEINSVGGEVFAGLGMYNMLRSWATENKTITTRVTGLAASIASVVALAGDKREMPKNAFAMIHAPSTGAWGTEEDLREAADVVAKIKTSLRSIYVDRMGVSEAKADELMSKDSWLTADEAKEIGFATDITDAIEATAKFDVSKLDLPPNATLFQARKTEPVADTPLVEKIVALATSAGFADEAPDIALQADSIEQASARIAQAREIKALCALTMSADKAATFIRSGKPVAEVRAALLKARADADPLIENTPPTPAPKPVPVHNPSATWEKHRAQLPKTKGR